MLNSNKQIAILANEETNEVKAAFICKTKDYDRFCEIADHANKRYFSVLDEYDKAAFSDVYDYIVTCLEENGFRTVFATVFTI